MTAPKYMEEILRQLKAGEMDLPRGEVRHITIRHDSWCQIFKGGPCNCNPEVGKPERVKKSWPEDG